MCLHLARWKVRVIVCYKRRELLGDFGRIAGYDVVEMAVAANATTLNPDRDTLHGPIVRIPEIPQVLASSDDGGILSKHGIIDSVRCLRSPYEGGVGGWCVCGRRV